MIGIIVVLCWWCSNRRKSEKRELTVSEKRELTVSEKSGKRELTVSANVSYGNMSFEAEEEELYANIDKLYGHSNKEELSSPKEFPAEPPEGAIAEEMYI